MRDEYAKANCAAPMMPVSQARPLLAALDDAEKASCVLGDSIDALEIRLSFVLQPEAPSPSNACAQAAPRPPVSASVDRVEELTGRIQRMARRLAGCLDRLDV